MSARAWPVLGATGLAIACGFPVKVGELDALDDVTGAETTFDPTVPTTTTSGESGDPPPPLRHDYAIRFADLPDVDDTGASEVGSSADGGSSSDSGGIGNPFDADALVVVATTGNDTCEDPFAVDPVCRSEWRVSFNLSLELQVAGATARLEDVNGFVSLSEPLEGDECLGGGGVLSGQLVVTGIDDTRVSARITEVFEQPFGTELDVAAVRCN